MDPPLVNESSFSQANPASYSLAEIWPFGDRNAGGLGLRMGSNLGQDLSGLVENSVNKDGSAEESTVTEVSVSRVGGKKRRDLNSEDESSKLNGNVLNNSNGKRVKTSGTKNGKCSSKAEGQTSSGAGNKVAEQSNKPSELPKQDYIHVRARRGQATDSHSLAERARREKISERMKTLQDLVPGCNKVIGKSLVLDEIINYIQSLQHQVEFLSMKIEAVNSTTNSTIEVFPPKDAFDRAGMIFSPQGTHEYAEGSQHEWLHMQQLGGNFERGT